MRARAMLLCLGVAVTATALTGCRGRITRICDEYCDCVGCSDRQYDDCIYDLERDEDHADRRGCLPEFDDWLACVDDDMICTRRGDFSFGRCGRERDDLRWCRDRR